MKSNVNSKTKKQYKKPLVKKHKLDNNISLVMMSVPGGGNPPW